MLKGIFYVHHNYVIAKLRHWILLLPLSFFPWLECVGLADYDRNAFFFFFYVKRGGGTSKEKQLALGSFLAYFY